MALHRTSNAQWEGNLKDGSGQMALGSGAWSGAFTFATRFEQAEGTNPEELIAAAHAGCFSMALSNELAKAGHTPDAVATSATVTLDPGEGRITTIHLETKGTVPGIDEATFQEFAEGAKDNCPVSKLLTGADVTVDATLTS